MSDDNWSLLAADTRSSFRYPVSAGLIPAHATTGPLPTVDTRSGFRHPVSAGLIPGGTRQLVRYRQPILDPVSGIRFPPG